MKLSVRGLAIASGVLWALALLLVGMGNLVFPPYGEAFLRVMASVYPGYQLGTGTTGIAISTIYGLVDAAIAGAVFAWLYNLSTTKRGFRFNMDTQT